MGSGSSGLYYGTREGSQPYQKFYHVVPEMLKKDKQDADIYSSKNGYFKNPTAVDYQLLMMIFALMTNWQTVGIHTS